MIFSELLFVYGTLMSGFSAHTLLKDAHFVAHGVLYGAKLLHVEDKFPAVIDGEGKVFGEVYRVETFTLKAVDIFEGFYEEFPENSFYLREKRPIRLIPYGDFVEAWVYILNPRFLSSLKFTEIPFGSWREFVSKLVYYLRLKF